MTEESNKGLDENIEMLRSLSSSMSDNVETILGSMTEQHSEDFSDDFPTDNTPQIEDLATAKQSIENSPFCFLIQYARRPDSKPTLPEDTEQL